MYTSSDNPPGSVGKPYVDARKVRASKKAPPVKTPKPRTPKVKKK